MSVPKDPTKIEQWRKNMRNSAHNRISPPCSEITKIKISKKLMGHSFTDKSREKMSISRTGKKHSKESNIKRSISLTGQKHFNWKGGISPINNQIRGSMKYKDWNRDVYLRDNYTDQKTGKRGGNLVAHHILNFSSHPELRFDVNNGITLSKESHNEFHKIYGKINNTKEQLLEFINK